MLCLAATRLGVLKDDVVFLGGCAVVLFITDPLAPDVRPTNDVDCVVDVFSLSHYHQLAEKLKGCGFKQSMDDGVICRWRYDDLILDVMPTDEKILGFTNLWYQAAIGHAVIQRLENGISIKSVTAPYFLATKLEAFKQRGKNDFLLSHDFEDIIAVIDGRAEIAQDVSLSDDELRKYLAQSFAEILRDEDFLAVLPGHLNYGSIAMGRAEIVLQRIAEIAENY
ncbi:MAG: hypothetical protein KAS93_01920 [Gammaproteobacteria bacterium]|nr:hypothetical protein [Gammaproteobacteria bacterium]